MKSLRRLTIAGGILGFGMGGFLDGIVLHQLLQWHHFVSNRVTTNTLEGMQLNTLWDGIFHSATYLITALGWNRPKASQLSLVRANSMPYVYCLEKATTMSKIRAAT
jgi:uncharacterized membrane protein